MEYEEWLRRERERDQMDARTRLLAKLNRLLGRWIGRLHEKNARKAREVDKLRRQGRQE